MFFNSHADRVSPRVSLTSAGTKTKRAGTARTAPFGSCPLPKLVLASKLLHDKDWSLNSHDFHHLQSRLPRPDPSVAVGYSVLSCPASKQLGTCRELGQTGWTKQAQSHATALQTFHMVNPYEYLTSYLTRISSIGMPVASYEQAPCISCLAQSGQTPPFLSGKMTEVLTQRGSVITPCPDSEVSNIRSSSG